MGNLGFNYYYSIKKQESASIEKHIQINWKKLFYYVGIMFATFIIVSSFNAFALFILNGKNNIFEISVSDNSTINLFFSLGLSSLLEFFFSRDDYNSISIKKWQNLSAIFLFAIVTAGMIINFAYTITDKQNELFSVSFEINAVYSILASIFILFNYITLSLHIKKNERE